MSRPFDARGLVIASTLLGCSTTADGAPEVPATSAIERAKLAPSARQDQLFSWKGEKVSVQGQTLTVGSTATQLGQIQGVAVDGERLVVVHRSGANVTASVWQGSERTDSPLILGGRALSTVAVDGSHIWVQQPDRKTLTRHALGAEYGEPTLKIPVGGRADFVPDGSGGAWVAAGPMVMHHHADGTRTPLPWPDPEGVERLAHTGDALWILCLSGRLVRVDNQGRVLSSVTIPGAGYALLPDDEGAFVLAGTAPDRATVHRIGMDGQVAWSSAELSAPVASRSLARVKEVLFVGAPGTEVRLDARTGLSAP